MHKILLDGSASNMYFGRCYNLFVNSMLKKSTLGIKFFIFFSHCTAVK